jgi:hypothetical protein
MPLLKGLSEVENPAIVEQLRRCENCGRVLPSSKSINFIGIIGSPGHSELMPFQCVHTEHWSCSIECWQKIAHACIDEHLAEMLKQKHQILGEKNNAK